MDSRREMRCYSHEIAAAGASVMDRWDRSAGSAVVVGPVGPAGIGQSRRIDQ